MPATVAARRRAGAGRRGPYDALHEPAARRRADPSRRAPRRGGARPPPPRLLGRRLHGPGAAADPRRAARAGGGRRPGGPVAPDRGPDRADPARRGAHRPGRLRDGRRGPRQRRGRAPGAEGAVRPRLLVGHRGRLRAHGGGDRRPGGVPVGAGGQRAGAALLRAPGLPPRRHARRAGRGPARPDGAGGRVSRRFDLADPAFDVTSAEVHAAREEDWYVETKWGWAVLRYAEVSALL